MLQAEAGLPGEEPAGAVVAGAGPGRGPAACRDVPAESGHAGQCQVPATVVGDREDGDVLVPAADEVRARHRRQFAPVEGAPGATGPGQVAGAAPGSVDPRRPRPQRRQCLRIVAAQAPYGHSARRPGRYGGRPADVHHPLPGGDALERRPQRGHEPGRGLDVVGGQRAEVLGGKSPWVTAQQRVVAARDGQGPGVERPVAPPAAVPGGPEALGRPGAARTGAAPGGRVGGAARGPPRLTASQTGL